MSRPRKSVVSEDEFESESEYYVNNEAVSEEPVSEEPGLSLCIEKVLGRKIVSNLDESSTEPLELFFIKWKQMSYLHASWEALEDIERVDPAARAKIKRFMLTHHPPGIKGEKPRHGSYHYIHELDDELFDMEGIEFEDVEYFSPEFVEVQRVISCNQPQCVHSTAKSPSHLLKMDDEQEEGYEIRYLIKWRGLGYNECSWEMWDDIKTFNTEVFRFWERQRPPLLDKLTPASFHPPLNSYTRLTKSPVFGELAHSSSNSSSTNSRRKSCERDDDSSPLEADPLYLRDYQLEGVNWLLWNWWHKRPSILADEMGLGKTIQSVCFLHQLRYMSSTNISGPFLLVAPLSLINQWQGEIAMWSPRMNCVVLHGSAEARDTILRHEFYFNEPFVSKSDAQKLRKNRICKFNILLTTFEIAMKDIKALSKIHWKALIVDEAHRLKNPSSRLFEHLTQIPRDHVLLLTGTPLQNKTEELWALLHFADKQRFNDLDDFVRKFGDLKDASHVAMLHSVLKPYLLRRIKEDVEKSLPPKEETVVEVALTSTQKQFYRAIYEKNTMHLFKGAKASNQPSLMNVMMELRKCCNHPYLVRGVEERILADITEEERADKDSVFRKMIESSGKLVLLDKLLPRLFSQGHKVLIFSQMVRVLNILEDFLRYKGYSYERLDGSTRASDRNDAVQRFIRPSMNRFIMLLSTKAGGLGLNLTAADTVIIFDSDWNPQNDIQAQARAHRIGQTKAVMVYRLLTRKTYEMHMFHKASLKLGLDRAVLAQSRIEQEDESGSGVKNNLSVQEIDELLKRGAYDVFREDDSEQREFADEDIDAILNRRSHKVVYDGKSNTETLGSFSKASFVSFDEKEDVDINDPDFWKKAVGLTETVSPEDTEMLELPQQRNRKKTQGYFDDTVDHDALEEYLKPIKANDGKGPKGAKTDKTPKNSKDKSQSEADKINNDPMLWGPHARDRVLRALNLFGFGRWSRIKQESGGDLRELKDVEAFARSYILQCGLYASEQELTKSDSDFVRDAVNKAKAVNVLFKSGQKKLDTPASLLDEKFVGKMKGGMAKKTLNRLDLLAKLISIVQKAVEQAFAAKKEPFDSTQDIDTYFSSLKMEEVCAHLPIGDVRPSWTKLEPWWDIECDKHLIIGTFRVGYGRYDLMKDDPDLCFNSKIECYVKSFKSSDDANAPSGNTSAPLAGEESSSVGDIKMDIDDDGYDGPEDDNADDILGQSGDIVDDDDNGSQKVTLQSTIADMFPDSALTVHNTLQVNIPFPRGKLCKLLIKSDRYSAFRGVYPQPGSCRWIAIYNSNKGGEVPIQEATSNRPAKASGLKFIGSFDTQVEAARAFDREARSAEGDAAQCNFNEYGVCLIESKFNEDGDIIEEEIKISQNIIQHSLPNQRSSKYRGVRASGQKWTAQISYDGGTHHLGTFSTELEAAMAYDATAKAHHGEGAALNFPKGFEEEVASIIQEPGFYIAVYNADGTIDRVVEGGTLDAKDYGSKFIDLSGRLGIAIASKSTKIMKSKNRRVNIAALPREEIASVVLPDKEKVVEDDDDENVLLATPSLFPKSSANRENSTGAMPDARTLNRLLIWLITSEEAKLMRADVKSKPKRSRSSKNGDNNNDKNDASQTKTSQIDYALYNSMAISEGTDVIRGLYRGVDNDVIAQIYKPQVNGLRKCEAVVKTVITQGYAEDTSVKQENSDSSTNGSSGTSAGHVPLDGVLTISAVIEGLPSVKTELAELGINVNAVEPEVEGPSASSLTEIEGCKLCCSFVLFGAPVEESLYSGKEEKDSTKPVAVKNESPEEPIKVFIPSPTTAPIPVNCLKYLLNFVIPQEETTYMNSFSYFQWSNIESLTGIAEKSDSVREFYYQSWLPFCVLISRSDINFSQKSIIPNPFRNINEHHPATRGLCQLFVQRQQFLRTMQYFLINRFDVVVEYLRSAAGRDCKGMPVWYCPWIHDIGLMIGCLKHGYLNLVDIFRDDSLPFTPSSIEFLVKRVFLYGINDLSPSTLLELTSIDSAEMWLKLVVHCMPNARQLETRIYRILADLTRSLSFDHTLRISFEGIDVKSLAANNNNGSEGDDGEKSHYNTRDRSGRTAVSNEPVETLPSTNSRKRPALSLKRFLLETSKRRRLVVRRIHGSLIEAQSGVV